MYRARAQVDAIAPCPWGAQQLPIIEDLENSKAYLFEHQKPVLIAIAFSSLEGSYWGGGIALIDASVRESTQYGYEQICTFQYDTGISSIAWCGDRKNLIACACDSGDIELLELIADVEFAFLPIKTHNVGHTDIATGISVSPLDASRFATCSWDRTIKLWEVARMDLAPRTLQGHTDLIWSVCFSPWSTNLLASSSQDCTIRLWDDRASNNDANVLTLASNFAVLSLDWHTHKDTILSVGLGDGSISTFDTRKSTKPLLNQTLHTGAIHTLRYSPFHSDLIGTGSDDASVRVTDRSEGASTLRMSSVIVAQHRDYVRALDWYACGSGHVSEKEVSLISGSWDCTVRSYSIDLTLGTLSSIPPGFT